jgi:uncharacterized protein YcaQ
LSRISLAMKVRRPALLDDRVAGAVDWRAGRERVMVLRGGGRRLAHDRGERLPVALHPRLDEHLPLLSQFEGVEVVDPHGRGELTGSSPFNAPFGRLAHLTPYE